MQANGSVSGAVLVFPPLSGSIGAISVNIPGLNSRLLYSLRASCENYGGAMGPFVSTSPATITPVRATVTGVSVPGACASCSCFYCLRWLAACLFIIFFTLTGCGGGGVVVHYIVSELLLSFTRRGPPLALWPADADSVWHKLGPCRCVSERQL